MAQLSAPPAVPWRTTMRERPVAAPRDTTWAVLLDLLGSGPDDLSVEPPWRHVRRLTVPGVELCERTVTLRDDGPACHLAWSAGLTAEVDDTAADALLDRLAADGEQLLERVARGATT
ncbi:MAG TPA: hypothetical protein VID94_10955 [Acidimicrobiales bacterium]|jgi:hypothetical protein